MVEQDLQADAVGEALRQAVSSVVRWTSRSRAPGVGPTPTEVWLMERIAEQGSLRMGALAALNKVDRSTMTAQVKRLVALGWVERSPDPADRRAVSIELTDEGRDVLRTTIASESELFDRVLREWPDDEVAELGRLLGRFARTLDRAQRSS